MTTHTSIWGTFAIDPATGLPVTPEGHFWRVKKSFATKYIDVELRRKLAFGSRRVFGTVVLHADLDEAQLFDACIYLLLRVVPRAAKTLRTDLLGDYPPKTLKEPA